jgi:ketosteroid isomerase-like protein
MRMAGPSMSILRKKPDGRWVVVRDANMVTPQES